MTAVPSEPGPSMASVRSFSTTALTEPEPVAAGEQIVYDFNITDASGKVLNTRTVTFNPPDTTILVMMIARLETSNDIELAATTINFFMSMVDDDNDVRYFNRRLFNRDDEFGSAQIAETLSAMVEDLGDRPTGPAPASSASHSGRGKTSKAKRHGHKSNHGAARSASGSPSSTTTSDAT